MIKFVFNFNGIYKYACVTCFFKNNLTNYLYFYDKNCVQFKCIHTYACYMLFLKII